MKITFLGTSHGIAEKNKFLSSAVITINAKHYIIDAGAPITTLLQNHGISFFDINGIFITHSHMDHYIGLAEFTFQMNSFNQFKGVRIPVFVPDPDRFQKLCYFLHGQETLNPVIGYDEKYNNGLYGSEPFYSRMVFNVYEEGVIFKNDDFKITSIKNQHTENSYSFLIEAEGKEIVFTGDLKHDIPDYPKTITERSNNLKLVVLEGAHTVLNKPEVLEKLKQSKTELMLINHRYEGCNSDEALADAANKLKDYFPVREAHDNDVIEI